MRVYKHKRTGEKISESTYNDLSYSAKDNYRYEGTATSKSDPLLSGIIGYATNSGILGGLIGGSILGGILGDALSDNDDSSIW